MRYMFPKKYGLPIRDDVLSWFLFGDTPKYGRVCKIKWTTEGKELFRRMYLSDLLAIDYRVSRMTTKDFEKQGIKMTGDNILKLQQSVAYIIYYYIFSGYHESNYVSKIKHSAQEVGRYYFTPEYFVMRSVFFLAAESNNGVPLNLDTISRAAEIKDMKDHLSRGYGYGDDFEKISDYIKDLLRNMPSDSNMEIIRAAREVLDGYHDIYEARRKEFLDSQDFKSAFQGRVYYAMNDLFGVEFISEKLVRSAVGVNEITTINDEGERETIKVHWTLAFDCYLELTRALKEYLGLDDRWIGIAIEAQGTYWHSDAFPNQQETDRKKRLICKEKNVLLIEIWENVKKEHWLSEVIRQIEAKTGKTLTERQFSELRKYLGNLRDT